MANSLSGVINLFVVTKKILLLCYPNVNSFPFTEQCPDALANTDPNFCSGVLNNYTVIAIAKYKTKRPKKTKWLGK